MIYNQILKSISKTSFLRSIKRLTLKIKSNKKPLSKRILIGVSVLQSFKIIPYSLLQIYK